jgi:hypothetical protein
MWNPQAMLARGSMAAALHIPFQTASKLDFIHSSKTSVCFLAE